MTRKAYTDYLDSAKWKRLRKAALKRDRGLCRSCGAKAVHVHHAHYPRVLGTEKLEWLYSMCKQCHESIHDLVRAGMTLRDATIAAVDGTHTIPVRKPRRKRKVRGPRGPRKSMATKGEATMEQILGLKLHLEKRR